MTVLPSDRWSSLPASGDPLTSDEQVLVAQMRENARAARERLQKRWQAEDNAAGPPP